MTVGRKWLLVTVASLLALGLAGVLLVPGLRWRAQLVVMKAQGRVRNVTWRELFTMMPPGSGYNAEGLLETGNPFASIGNPYVSAADVESGARIYRTLCDQCHAQGRSAPDLLRAQLTRGTSWWGLYRAVKDGVPATAMAPQPLSDRERWQAVAYIRAARRDLATQSGGRPPELPPATASFERLSAARGAPAEWLTYSGGYDGWRFSRLAQINAGNAARLRLLWMFQLPPSADRNESSPLVVGNTMYLTASPNHVWALDVRSGRPGWHYERQLPPRLPLCCGAVNRGLAVLDNTLYLGTLDAHLVALDAQHGNVEWDVEVASSRQGYSITGAPLVVRNRVITGVAGGEFGAPGFIDAYDAATGRRLWRFQTIPQPGDPARETWGGESWRTGAAPTWLTGSYDPELDLIYWGVGNPGPNYAGAVRPGRNLYSNSVVALDAQTGRMRWYFQFTPHDEHDWDSNQIPILVDARFGGRMRHLLLWANRNAFYYVLDRETGQFLRAAQFEHQTWAEGIDSTGQPISTNQASPSDTGTFVYPSVVGATNWWSPSYHPTTGLLYVPALHMAGTYFLGTKMQRGELFTGGASSLAYFQPNWSSIKAIVATSGQISWEFRLPTAAVMGGLLSTAGGVVFGGAGPAFFALDAVTGRKLWEFNTGGGIAAAPIAFQADGQQRIAIVAGNALLVFGLTQS